MDLTGQKFNSLTVISLDIEYKGRDREKHWLCKCDCGNPNLKSIRGSSLKNGHSKTCGECKFYNILNKKFGRLTIRARQGEYLICDCDCGETDVKVARGHLMDGHTQSCGCLNLSKAEEKMLGKRFGKLVVLESTKGRTYKQNIIWKCQCDCGNIAYADTDVLVKGEKSSCGCLTQSKGEYFIENLLKENNLNYQKEYSFKDLVSLNGSKCRFDFYISNSYIIEFDGEQHFNFKSSGWNTEEHFIKLRENDLLKNQFCFNKGIPIIRIPYTHLDNIILEDLLLETSTFILTPEMENNYYEKFN